MSVMDLFRKALPPSSPVPKPNPTAGQKTPCLVHLYPRVRGNVAYRPVLLIGAVFEIIAGFSIFSACLPNSH
jgi:hypothetical protein